MPRGPTTKRSPKRAVVVVPKRGEPWELPELDHERRDETIARLGEVVEQAGLPYIGPDGWSAAYFWWANVFGDRDNKGGQDPLKMALYAFGATKEQCEDTSTPFGFMFSRMMVALNVKHGRRVATVEDALYTGACNPESTAAQKLYLQAHKPEKYVPVTKSRLTIEDIAEALREASDDEVKRSAGIEDSGVGAG